MCRLSAPSACLAAASWAASLGATSACQNELDGTALAPRSTSGPGGELTSPRLDGEAFVQRAPNSSRESQLFFNSGQGFYVEPWLTPPSPILTRAGLGPLYNARACVECHLGGGRGRPPLEPGEAFVGLVLRLGTGARGPSGEPEPDPIYGEQLQTLGIAGVDAEGTPRVVYSPLEGSSPEGEPLVSGSPTYHIESLQYGPTVAPLALSPRVAPPTFGLGLLEAIPEARLLELEDADDRDGDGVSGRLNRVWDRQQGALAAGRFGWKAEQPNLRQQIAAALAADLGVTSHLYTNGDCSGAESACLRAASALEPELSERVLDRLESYLRLLAVPARRAADDSNVRQGEQLFTLAGCAACHVPSHITASEASLPELESQRIWPYTDLLLHDLGAALGDERPSFSAEGGEWRTPPLWGLGLYRVVSGHQRLLHDGRADGVAAAILWHGGEAAGARETFEALSPEEREQLIAFVESL